MSILGHQERGGASGLECASSLRVAWRSGARYLPRRPLAAARERRSAVQGLPLGRFLRLRVPETPLVPHPLPFGEQPASGRPKDE
jgi:hypothetical protein